MRKKKNVAKKARRKTATSFEKKIITLVKGIDEDISEIAKLRDQLRDKVEKYDSIIASIDEAEEHFLDASTFLQEGLNSLSQYL